MLCNEHRMPAHGRLLAVVRDICRGKPRPDEVLRVPPDRIHALIRDVLSVPVRQAELRAEGGLLQTGEGLVYGCHECAYFLYILCKNSDCLP